MWIQHWLPELVFAALLVLGTWGFLRTVPGAEQ